MFLVATITSAISESKHECIHEQLVRAVPPATTAQAYARPDGSALAVLGGFAEKYFADASLSDLWGGTKAATADPLAWSHAYAEAVHDTATHTQYADSEDDEGDTSNGSGNGDSDSARPAGATAPIRIVVDTRMLEDDPERLCTRVGQRVRVRDTSAWMTCSSGDVFTQEKRQVLYRLLPQAIDAFRPLLRVSPVQGRLRLSSYTRNDRA
jgi:hypothetical protein